MNTTTKHDGLPDSPDGGPAFPNPLNRSFPECGGLTKREWYAGLIMQGLLAKDGLSYNNRNVDAGCYAEMAVVAADALIRELNKAS